MTKSKISVKSNFLQSPYAQTGTKTNKKSDPKNEVNNKKRKAKKSRTFITTIIIFIFSLIIIVGLFVTGIFNIKDYKVTGNSQLTSKDIEDIVKKDSYGKLILTVNPVSIEKELVDKFSLISYARVIKDLPSTLKIEIKERTVAIAAKTLDNLIVISQDGYVIQNISLDSTIDTKYGNIKIVTMVDEPKRNIGYKFDSEYINMMTTFVNKWEELKAPQYSNMIIDKEKNVRIILNSGTNIVLSLHDNSKNINELITNAANSYDFLSKNGKIKSMDLRFDKIAVVYENKK